MLSATLFTPICFAIFAASPEIASVGRPLVSRTTSKSTHLTPRRQPVPSAFIAASFAANRPAYRSYLFLKRSQYSRSLVVYTRLKNTSPCRSIAPWMRSTSAMSTPIPMINTPPVLLHSANPADSDYTGRVVTPTKTVTARRGIRKSRARAGAPTAWTERNPRGVRILQVPALAKLAWLVHGFSTKPGGVSDQNGERVLNLSFTDWDTKDNVFENRRRFQSALGASDLQLVSLKQIHSDVIHLFDAAPTQPCQGDASVSNRPGLLLGVQTADCVPILLVDPKKRAIAAIHAGWRGTLQRIVVKAIGQLQMQFKSKPADLLAAVGPSIGGCCYEVGTEVATQFLSQFAEAPEWFDEFRTGDEPNPVQWLNMMPPGHQPPPKNVLLDLRKANRAQLLGAGLRDSNIFVSDLCTACRRDLLFSYRKEGPQSGRLLSVIGIR
jgi:purine-nucleoside/S-methyl-5'-thioadenosine phosphorylase / adenosine deaminase